MIINDTLYGTFEIDDVLSELIHSVAFNRLKGVHTGGATYLVNPLWDVTRYDHSIGAMLLSRILGGNIEQQIKALLHDIAHTAFSHTIDYVLENAEEDYHDNIQQLIIDESDIPQILAKYNFTVEGVFDEEYLVLDADLPALSVDRIDYTLRDMQRQQQITNEEIESFVNSLCVAEDIVCTRTVQQAEWFSKLYDKEVLTYFQHPLNIEANSQLTSVLRLAMKNGTIVLADFNQSTDGQLLNLLKEHGNLDVQQALEKLFSLSIETYDAKEALVYQGKKRKIDPGILHNSSIILLSEI